MGCEKGARPIKKKVTLDNENLNEPQKEQETMSSTMVRQQMPEFTMDAYDAKTGKYKT
ncbi:MAG: peroxiredoxin, partial [Bacteroidales bacterium]|nr:peroxiredoxin [Bacteroidales bacterium]